MYEQRIARAQEIIRQKNLGGMVIGTGPELTYFTGETLTSHERLTALVINQSSATLVAPVTDVDSVTFSPVRGWSDGTSAYEIVASLLDDGPVALGSSLTANHVLTLQEYFPTQLLPSGLFQVKEDYEIEHLARAGQAIDKVHAKVPGLLRAGKTEAEVAAELSELILEEHATVDFIIVGSGPNGANPHHDYSSRALQPGDPVVVDIGGTLDTGYRSDSTRTYLVEGEAPEGFLDAYEAVKEAYLAARNQARPGVSAESVDRAAREAMGKWAEHFSHRTGHGIGLSTHEEPYIVEGNGLTLEPGMAFSIEPGTYIQGKWGIRIEDIVCVSDEGVQRLNLQPIELR